MSDRVDVLVTGASGHVGRQVAAQLRDLEVPFRVAARNPAALGDTGASEVVAADLTRPETLPAALAGVTRVFLYAVPSHAEEFCAAARAAGVEHVVLLSSHTVVEWLGLPLRKPIADMHRTVERALTESGIAATFLRPAHFAANVLMWRWDRMIRATGTVRFPYPESYCDAIHEADIAAVGVRALTEPGHQGQAYFLTGPAQVSQREQAEIIAAGIGRPVTFQEISAEEARAQLAEVTPEWAMDAVLGYWKASDGVPGPLSDTVQDILGRPPLSFARWVRDHRERFLP